MLVKLPIVVIANGSEAETDKKHSSVSCLVTAGHTNGLPISAFRGTSRSKYAWASGERWL